MTRIKTGGISVEVLNGFIQRIEKLEDEKSNVAHCIRDVFAEAKANGFDNKAMRQVLKLRKLRASERQEQEYMLDLYKRALGMDGVVEGAEDAA